MPQQSHLLILAVLLLLVSGSFHTTPGHQVPVGNEPSDPAVHNAYLMRTRPSNQRGSKKLSPAAEKRAAIEQALKDGNEAREAGDYDKAFLSYQKVAEKLDPKDPRAVYGLGNVYSDLSCLDEGIQSYTEALQLDSNFYDARIALGYVYLTKRKYDDSEAQFRDVLEKKGDHPGAKIGLAYVTGQKKMYDEAVKQFHLVLNSPSPKDEDRALAYLLLSDIYLRQQKWEDAKSSAKRALRHNPRLTGAYWRLGQAELNPERARFSQLSIHEQRLEDRERLVKAADKAAEYIRTAITQRKNYLFGYLLLSNALISQFNYTGAISALEEYDRQVKELQKRSVFLAPKCNAGFKQLYAFGHLYLALVYNQQSILEKDEAKQNEFNAKVIEYAGKLTPLKQDDVNGYSLLGQVYFRSKNYAGAVQQLEQAIISETDDDSKGGTRELIGFCYEQLGHDKEARHAYNEALKLRPNSKYARIGLANINERSGNFDEAIRFKREAMELTANPTASLLWQLASTYFARARRQNQDADYEEAITLLKKAVETSQSFAPAYVTLGDVYKFYKRGAYADEALANYQQGEKYAPKDAGIKFLIGDLFYAVKKNYEAAINYFEEAIKLKPDYAIAHWELGLVHRDKKNNEEAIKHLKTALSLDDKYLDAYVDLINIYERQKHYDEAIKILLKAADKLPLEYLPYKELGRLYSYQQKNEEAIRYYEEAIKRVTADEEWYKDLLRCRIVRLRGQFADAITCVQKIKLTGSADPAQIPYEIGWTHIASKNKDAALAQYEELKRRNSNLAEDLMRAISEMK